MNEELGSVVQEQRERLEAMEAELVEVRRRMDRLWYAVETSDLEINDILPRLRQHQARQEKLEVAAAEARAVLEGHDNRLSEETLAAYAQEMSEFLMKSELTESRAFIRSFVKEISVSPGKAVIHYTMPTPPDSPIRGGTAAEVALESPVLPTVTGGSACGIRTRDLRLERAVS